ncbi:MAG: radical SAM protein, partial [Candidatus Omnitrophica bacterium]|nr:radical SAM protein [Candidatus Omnitrophota bacterium]
MPKTIMPLSYIEKIVRQLKELGVKAVSLSADGEPALHPQIKKIIDIIKNNGISLRITTNLTFGKNELFSSFAKADILVVNLSAPDAKLYRKFCSPVSEKPFLNLAHNLKMFSTLFRKRGKPNIILNYIITRNNYVYIEKMLDFADSLKLPFIRFRILDTTLETKKLFLTHEEILELHSIINKISRSNYSVKHDLRNLLAFRKKADFNLKRCFIGWLALSIENNGDIVFCCQNPWLKIGNWKRDSL